KLEIVRVGVEGYVSIENGDFHRLADRLADVARRILVSDLHIQHLSWESLVRQRGVRLILERSHGWKGDLRASWNNFEERSHTMSGAHVACVLRVVVEVLMSQDAVLVS